MLNVKNVCLNFETRVILKDISFYVDSGEVLAITGPNGSGKTTLIKTITEEINPESGTISYDKGIEWANVSQENPDINISVQEFLLDSFPGIRNIYRSIIESEPDSMEAATAISNYAEMNGYYFEEKIARKFTELGFDKNELKKSLNEFSEGQRRLIYILQMFLSDADLFIMDEPNNHLDIAMSLELEEEILALKKKGKTFLIVSHDRVLLDRVADRTLWLERGKGMIVQGGYTKLIEFLDRDFQTREQHAKEINRKIKQLEQEVRRRMEWSSSKEKEKAPHGDNGRIGHLAARLAKRGKAVQKRKEGMISKLAEEKPFVEKKLNLLFPKYNVRNRRMVSSERVSFSYGSKEVIKNVSIELTTLDRVGIIGTNGSGKSTLMKCLIGGLKGYQGKINRNNEVKSIYLPQNIREYFKKRILLDNFMNYGINESKVRQYLGAAGLRRNRVLSKVSILSFGEVMRAAIVSAILLKAEFLFLDEPTNHLDIESLEILDSLFSEYPGGLLFISHDRHFISSHGEKLYRLENGLLKTWSF